MSFLISTGLQTHLLTTGDLKTALDGTVVKIYGSDTSLELALAGIPATADAAAITGTIVLLCTVKVDGETAETGVTFENVPVGGALPKTASEDWTGVNEDSGYPSFYRIELDSDTDALSTSAIRGQGTVGQIGTDLIIAASYLTSAETQDIDSFLVGIPTS